MKNAGRGLALLLFFVVMLPSDARAQRMFVPEVPMDASAAAVADSLADAMLLSTSAGIPGAWAGHRTGGSLVAGEIAVAQERSHWPAIGVGALIGAVAGGYVGYRSCLESDAILCVPIFHVAVGAGVGGLVGYVYSSENP